MPLAYTKLFEEMSNGSPIPRRRVYADLFVGVTAIVVLILVKVYIVENSYFERWCNARGYEVLHKIIPPFDPDRELSVIVLDISGLRLGPDGATPTESLREIVQALADSGAKAIALDIDFSARIDREMMQINPRAEGDDEFFSFLQQQSVPVFLGVYEGVGPDPETWLGLDERKKLAADMTIYDEDTTQLPRWLSCGDAVKLNSISMALAGASGQAQLKEPLLKSFLEDPESEENLKYESIMSSSRGVPVVCRRAFTFVNYAKLKLIQKLAIPVFDRASILSSNDEEGKNKFRDKLVIVGDGQRGTATDGFVIIGHDKPIAGVYLNASATYTLVDEPIYRPKHWVVITLDIVLGLILVLTLLLIRMRHVRVDKESFRLSEGMAITILAITPLVSAWVLVKFFQVLWLDVPFVIFAIFLHSRVQDGLEWIPMSIYRKIKS